MASQFNFLAKAKPASLYKLLEKLPTDEAAIVLTGLPHTLAIQSLAFFPDHLQGAFLPMMREARNAPAGQRDVVAEKIRAMLGAAKAAREGKTAVLPKADRPVPDHSAPTPPGPKALGEHPPAAPMSLMPKFTPPRSATGANQQKQKDAAPLPPEEEPAKSPSPAASAAVPIPPKQPPPRSPAATRKAMPGGHNPYESAPPPKTPPHSEDSEKVEDPAPASPFAGLGTKLKDVLNKAAASAAGQLQGGQPARAKAPEPRPPAKREKSPEPRPANFGKPVPWVPRTATSSPINGPALPGKPPPVAGDPFKSPLARAGLLDLIGRAQERFMPKDTTARTPPVPSERPSPSRPRPSAGKAGRPEPREGVASMSQVDFDSTPRVIGPRPKRAAPSAGEVADASSGARRMDGKAILAAILREAGPDVRGSVQDDDPALMRELRGRMFYFDDLIYTEDGALAKVFTAAPADTAALALKFASPALRKRVLRAVSPGRAKALEDAPGRAGFDAVESAQKKVLNVALQLQAAGRILIDPRDPDLAGK